MVDWTSRLYSVGICTNFASHQMAFLGIGIGKKRKFISPWESVICDIGGCGGPSSTCTEQHIKLLCQKGEIEVAWEDQSALRVGETAPCIPGCPWDPASGTSWNPTDLVPRNPWDISVWLLCIVLSLLFIRLVGWFCLNQASLLLPGAAIFNTVALIV